MIYDSYVKEAINNAKHGRCEKYFIYFPNEYKRPCHEKSLMKIFLGKEPCYKKISF